MSGCASEKVKQGDIVLVDYTGTFENGEVFDSSLGKQPLAVTMGKGQVISGFEEALFEMAEGEEKTITLPPEKAYGDYNKNLIQDVSKENMAENVNLKVGEKLYAVDSNGFQKEATIVSLNNNTITIDLNHPLAGKTLNFKIKIIEINEG